MMKVKCPDCKCEFEIENDYKVGEVTSCPCCGLELEVKSLNPVKVQELVIEGCDWGE
jgi:lysine biosynthesis protein LysW